jgi:hypothetical protein
MNIFCECERDFVFHQYFLANAKSNFGATLGLFYGFFGFSGKMVVFPMQISSENKTCALRIGTAPFCIRKAFGFMVSYELLVDLTCET